jgi:hypothetical protein
LAGTIKKIINPIIKPGELLFTILLLHHFL